MFNNYKYKKNLIFAGLLAVLVPFQANAWSFSPFRINTVGNIISKMYNPLKNHPYATLGLIGFIGIAVTTFKIKALIADLKQSSDIKTTLTSNYTLEETTTCTIDGKKITCELYRYKVKTQIWIDNTQITEIISNESGDFFSNVETATYIDAQRVNSYSYDTTKNENNGYTVKRTNNTNNTSKDIVNLIKVNGIFTFENI